MSQKRKRTEQADGDHHAQAPTRKRPFIPGKGHGKLKPKRPDNGAESKGTSISELKSRIRNLRRLLEHVESEPKHRMPANVRIERVRELATCQHELAEKTAAVQEAERRRNMVSKYHHIRFFDRQKATRVLKRLQKQLTVQKGTAEASEESKAKMAGIEQKIHDAEIAVNYAIYYPLIKPYCALYGRTKQEKDRSKKDIGGEEAEAQHQDTKEHAAKGDPKMWAAVEHAMAEGTLDELRNSDDGVATRRAKATQAPKKDKAKEKKRPQSRHAAQETTAANTRDDGDDSDGGFFE